MSTSDRMAQFNPQAPGSISVAFYDSQGHGGDIITRLHTEYIIIINSVALIRKRTIPTERPPLSAK
jgi:hypothetical protein